MHRWTTLFSLFALIALIAGSAAAQAPDPTQDLEEEFMGCRPGACDVIDYEFGVKNNSATHDYIIKITGTPQVLIQEYDGSPPTLKYCCGGAPCERQFTGEEQILLAGQCDAGRVTVTPKFPECDSTCDCDVDGDCDDHPWCATIDDPMVVVSRWKAVNEEEWHPYAEPIVLCHGKGQSGMGGAPACNVVNWCAGQNPGPCYPYTLCNN